MSATNRALPLHLGNEESIGAKLATPMPLQVAAASEAVRVPALRVTPLLSPGQPRRFFRVPTHAVGVNRELREYPRASLKLPLRLRKVDDVAEEFPVTLVTRDISSTGVFFLCPKEIVWGRWSSWKSCWSAVPWGTGASSS